MYFFARSNSISKRNLDIQEFTNETKNLFGIIFSSCLYKMTDQNKSNEYVLGILFMREKEMVLLYFSTFYVS